MDTEVRTALDTLGSIVGDLGDDPEGYKMGFDAMTVIRKALASLPALSGEASESSTPTPPPTTGTGLLEAAIDHLCKRIPGLSHDQSRDILREIAPLLGGPADAQGVGEALKKEILDCVPTTWLDSLLTGPDKVVGSAPFTCDSIERLCKAIKGRLRDSLGHGSAP